MSQKVNCPLPPGLSEEGIKTLLDQIPYVTSNVVGSGREGASVYVNLDPPAADPAPVAAALAGLASRVERSYAKIRHDVVFEHRPAAAGGADPMPHLRKTGQAIETGPGRFTVQGDLWKVMAGLDRLFRRYALTLGAAEQHHPTTVPVTSMIEAGYLKAFPQHALLVSSFHNELENLSAVSADPAQSLQGTRLAAPAQMLAPTVCYHCFEALRGGELPAAERLYTAAGYCHRDEGPNTGGLLRVQTFYMREIICFGERDAIETRRRGLMAHVQSLFVRWGVSFSVVSATDPFFAGAGESKRVYQSLQGLKHELRMDLPYDGTSTACASFNNHQDALTQAYAIAGPAGRHYSGCTGYGFERMAYGLMAQFGVALERWPASLREDVLEG